MGWSDWLPSLITTGASLYGATQANDAAQDASATNDRMVDFNIGQGERAIGLSNEGGDSILKAIQAAMGQIGGSPYSAGEVDRLASMFSGNRAGEREHLNDVLDFGTAFGASSRDSGLNDVSGRADSLGLGQNEYESLVADNYMPPGLLRDQIAGGPASGSYTAGISGGPARGEFVSDFDFIDTPDTDVSAYEGGYDALVNRLSQDYLDRFSSETDRSAREAIGQQQSDSIRKGMERSTYDIESGRAVADTVARRRNQDVVAAVEQAVKHVASRQGLDTGNQQMRLAELEGGLGRASHQLGEATGRTNARASEYDSRLRNDMTSLDARRGEFDDQLRSGMARADAIGREFDWTRQIDGDRIDARRAAFDDRITGLNASQGLMTNAANYGWGNRMNALNEFTAREGAIPNEWATSRAWAQGDIGTTYGLRGTTLDETLGLVQAPYQFKMTGFAPASQFGGTAADLSRTNLAITSDLAKGAGSGFARQLEAIPWGSIGRKDPPTSPLPGKKPTPTY